MKAVLFDLDDTLYPEMEFVRGGFRAAARHLAGRHGLDTERLYEEMLDVLGRDGRGRVFDRVLEDHGLLSAEAVALMVYIYRTHRPSLRPDDDARATLEALRQADVRLGLVTDGMGSVQRRKIAALEIEDLFEAVVCTDELGAGCGNQSSGHSHGDWLVAGDGSNWQPGRDTAAVVEHLHSGVALRGRGSARPFHRKCGCFQRPG